jgi:5-methylcytosine-specific restriction endonuclease McrA
VDHSIDGSNLVSKRSAKHQFRQQIFEAWGHQCAYCSALADTLDHVKPRHKGGATVTTNLVPACRNCNRRKGSEKWREWFSRQESWTVDRALKIQDWLIDSTSDDRK